MKVAILSDDLVFDFFMYPNYSRFYLI